jgi:AraC family transcriptional regulator of adaptative response/methylated-DNA-[protein]-cysteine methyltransferase
MSDPAIAYTIRKTSLGWLLVAATARGVCHVRFGDSDQTLEGDLAAEFPYAPLRRDDAGTRRWADVLLAWVEGRGSHLEVPLDVRGSCFQRRVWDALRAIPCGTTRSYGELAASLGRSGAARAVARACAANPVAVAIPCHRVVERGGGLGGYRWGAWRKRALLAREAQTASPLQQGPLLRRGTFLHNCRRGHS